MGGDHYDAIVVGGGPGGLAVSQQLSARRIVNVVLVRGDRAAWMWENVYDSLRLHTGKHLSSLPGMSFPAGTSLFPTRREFTAYIEAYVDRFNLPLRTGAEVTGLRRQDGVWVVDSDGAEYRSRVAVVATGIMSSPLMPDFPGAASFTGRILHSSDYKRPDEFLDSRVLVVGIGNSAAEIASELTVCRRERCGLRPFGRQRRAEEHGRASHPSTLDGSFRGCPEHCNVAPCAARQWSVSCLGVGSPRNCQARSDSTPVRMCLS